MSDMAGSSPRIGLGNLLKLLKASLNFHHQKVTDMFESFPHRFSTMVLTCLSRNAIRPGQPNTCEPKDLLRSRGVRSLSNVRVSPADVQGLPCNLAYFVARFGLEDGKSIDSDLESVASRLFFGPLRALTLTRSPSSAILPFLRGGFPY